MSITPLCERLRKTLPRARTAVTQPAGCPAIALHLYDPSVLEGPLSHDEAQAVQAEPAYWSFCWASGQVLARYLLDNPHLVAGKRVVDVGCGSGVVAIAAALAGAHQVFGCDLDEDALAATACNAALNGVSVELCSDWHQLPGHFDVVTAADVLYDRDNLPLVNSFVQAAPLVLLADSRVRDFAHPAYELLTTGEARTWPDLHEFEEFNRVRIFAGCQNTP